MGGAKKDPNAPKRPLSAYFIFMGKFKEIANFCFIRNGYFLTPGEKRAEVKAANPDYKIGDIAKVINICVKCIECNCCSAGDGQNVAGAGREGQGSL